MPHFLEFPKTTLMRSAELDNEAHYWCRIYERSPLGSSGLTLAEIERWNQVEHEIDRRDFLD